MVTTKLDLDNKNAFQLKGSLFTLTILQLQNPDPKAFAEQLKTSIDQAPKFFVNAPIVIDLQPLSNVECRIDFEAMNQLLREHQLIPIAICGGNKEQQQAALAAGLAKLPNSKHEQDIKPKSQAKEIKKQPELNDAKIITQPVRSGQQIYAKNADLIIVSSVSPGAEVLADGNIHIYGTLRGRALAGINGNKSARIFCQNLDAELVSIAGLYQLSDDFAQNQSQHNLQIYLENERLKMTAI